VPKGSPWGGGGKEKKRRKWLGQTTTSDCKRKKKKNMKKREIPPHNAPRVPTKEEVIFSKLKAGLGECQPSFLLSVPCNERGHRGKYFFWGLKKKRAVLSYLVAKDWEMKKKAKAIAPVKRKCKHQRERVPRGGSKREEGGSVPAAARGKCWRTPTSLGGTAKNKNLLHLKGKNG